MAGDIVASQTIGYIRDGDSRLELEAVVAGGAGDIAVAGAVAALANIAAVESMPVMIELAKVASGSRLKHTVRYFWRTGTSDAVEALAAMLEISPAQVAMPLAKLGDERGVRAMIDLLRPASLNFEGSYAEVIAGFPPGSWCADLLRAFDESTDLEAIVERAVDGSLLQLLQLRADQQGLERPRTLDEWVGDDYRVTEQEWIRRTSEHVWQARLHRLAVLAELVVNRCGDEGATAVARTSEQLGVDLLAFLHRSEPAADAEEPELARPTVPGWELDYELGDPHHPGTRFGGQPTWLESPTWPLNPVGTPMAFWAQFRLPEEPGRMAYLFVDNTDDIIMSDAGTAAVFVQPGGKPAVPWADRATGPVLPDRVQRDRSVGAPAPWSLAARVPSLRPLEDLRQVELSRDRVGGHPTFLQGDPSPEGFDFLCQFTAAEAGHELADGAQCYLYVNHDDGAGLFLWDCH